MDTPEKFVDVKTLETMPDEVIIRILQQLDPPSLVKVCQTSKKLSRLCKDKDIWKAMYKRDITDKKPCLDWDWERLYFTATQVYAIVFNVTIEDMDTFLVVGEENLDPHISRHLKNEYDYTDEDIEIMYNDIGMKHGFEFGFAVLVGDFQEAEEWELPNGQLITIEDLGTVQISDVFRLLPLLEKRNPKRKEI